MWQGRPGMVLHVEGPLEGSCPICWPMGKKGRRSASNAEKGWSDRSCTESSSLTYLLTCLFFLLFDQKLVTSQLIFSTCLTAKVLLSAHPQLPSGVVFTQPDLTFGHLLFILGRVLSIFHITKQKIRFKSRGPLASY